MSNNELQLSGINWRYTAYKARLGPFDANLVFPPIIIFALHISWFTFILMILVIIVMYMVEIFMSMPLRIALRSLRNSAAGSLRTAIPWWKKMSL